VVETSKKILGLERRDTLMSIHNLAATYDDHGKKEKAEELLTQVVEIFKEVLGLEHPDTLVRIGDLAIAYRDQRQLKKAEELEK
jgi:hypothetical protein